MTNQIDARAILLGAGIFVLGCLILGGLSMLAGEDEATRRIVSGITQICGVLLPVVSGFSSAYFARTRPILQGAIAGAIGALPVIALSAAVVVNFPAWAVFLALAFFAFLSSFGAIFGSHLRAKQSPN
ncbi:hypothetical protein [Arenimonas terrae]|uniref:Uncharacterized protein n=1 Tax=Arenimonas terrae TaxID=2546226 RepID=A0A5C4RNZ9_9GAMM|nr:hypothetical protein [Arenimonas terrae]TNJ32639.1 hypothetical protein E1B00_14665 [Arenimonas terrae]